MRRPTCPICYVRSVGEMLYHLVNTYKFFFAVRCRDLSYQHIVYHMLALLFFYNFYLLHLILIVILYIIFHLRGRTRWSESLEH